MKKVIAKSFILAGFATMGSTAAMAADNDGGLYIGAFGGVGSTSSQSVEQTGTAHKGFTHADEYYSYDLHVDVDGENEAKAVTVLGGQIGYQWNTGSVLKPALEVEGAYLSANQRADLLNADDDGVANVRVTTGGTPVVVDDQDVLDMVTEHVLDTPLSAGNHTFTNTAKMKVALFTLNGVLTCDTGSALKPYIGAGVGLAFVNMRNAVSQQTGPGSLEMGQVTADSASVPINHFNSRDNASDIAFAVQVKGGARLQVSDRVSLFAEYRFVRLAATDYTFGSTVYYTHAPTDNWVVRNGVMNLHNAVAGIRFGF